MFELLARWLGWKTTYHVSWASPVSTGCRSGDMILIVSPWITVDNWYEARAAVAKENELEPDSITVISVTKL